MELEAPDDLPDGTEVLDQLDEEFRRFNVEAVRKH